MVMWVLVNKVKLARYMHLLKTPILNEKQEVTGGHGVVTASILFCEEKGGRAGWFK